MADTLASIKQLDRQLGEEPAAMFALLLVVLGLGVFWSISPLDIPLRMPDSTSYIRFDGYRGAGYPMLLHAVRLFSQELGTVVIVQSVLFFSSLAVLVITFCRFSRSILASLLLVLAIGGNPELVRYNGTILTEALFFASTFLALATLFSGSRIVGTARLFLCAALIAWLVQIKPVAWAFISIPVLLFIQSCFERRMGRALVALILGFGLTTLACSTYRHAIHGEYSADSFIGNQIIGKLIYADFDAADSSYPEAAAYWLDKTAPLKRIRNEELKTPDEKFLFSLTAYDYMRFDQEQALFERMNVSPENQRPAQHHFAMNMLTQDSGAYIDDVLLNLYALWTVAILQPPSAADNYNARIDAADDLVPEGLTPYRTDGANPLMVFALKTILLLAAAVSILIILGALFTWMIRWHPHSALFHASFLMAASCWSYFLLVSLFQAALLRYLLAAWPLLVILGLLALLMLWERRAE